MNIPLFVKWAIVSSCLLTISSPVTIAESRPLKPSPAVPDSSSDLDTLQVTDDAMTQVTGVSKLADVQPTDWSHTALKELIERYGCLAGYSDQSYRGDRTLSRNEFAAGLNACVEHINTQLAQTTETLIQPEDLLAIKQLQKEFAAELAIVQGQIGNLETRTATLTTQQFSTTTKLFGQAVVGFQGRTQSNLNLAGLRFSDKSTQINLISNLQLSLLTQFDNRNILLTGLQAGTGNTYGETFLTNDVLLGYEGDTQGKVVLSDLTYRHLIGDSFAIVAGPIGVNPVNVLRGANRVESAGQGPLSRFAQRNPIQNIGGDGGGIGFDWQISSTMSLQAVYSVSKPNDSIEGSLFGGKNGAMTFGAQLVLVPLPQLDLAVSYINAYSPFGNLGTSVGDDQLALLDPESLRAPLKTNAIGLTLAWRMTPHFTIGGWAGYTHSVLPGTSGRVETVNWMAFLNFLDLGGPGNLGAIYVGQPPKIFHSDLPTGRNVPNFLSEGGPGDAGGQPDTTTHVEVFYRFQISDNVSMTPGFILIFNPLHNSNNDMISIGAIRMTVTF